MNAAQRVIPRRRLLLGAAAGGTGLALAACSPSPQTPPVQNVAKPTGTLQVLVSSADASDRAFRELSDDFEAANPGVTVEFSAVPNQNFAASRSSRLTAGNVDVTLAAPVQVPGYVTDGVVSDDAAAADGGLFLDLTGQPFLGNFTPSVIESIKYNGKDFTVPTGLSYYTGVFYNKDVFAKHGLEVPTTWTEFESLVAALRSADVVPLGVGGKEGWPAGLGMLAAVQGLYPSTADKIKLAEQLWKKEISLADGTQLEVLKRVKSLYDAAQPNFAGVSSSTIPSSFAAGEFAMTIDGTWNQATIAAAIGKKFEYGYFPLPVNVDPAANQLLGGKVELRMVVATNAPNSAAGLAYLEFFSRPETYRKFVETTGFAPAQPNIPASDFLESIVAHTEPFSPAWDTIWVANPDAGQAAVFPFNYPGIAPLGSGTAEQAAQESEQAWRAVG